MVESVDEQYDDEPDASHRRRVASRADFLRRRHRKVLTGVSLAVIMTLLGAGTVLAKDTGRPTASANSRPSAPVTTAPSSGAVGVPPTNAGVMPRFGGSGTGAAQGGPTYEVVFADEPSGSTRSAYRNVGVIVLLPSPVQGRWSSSVVVTGHTSSLKIESVSASADGAIQVNLHSAANGTATVTVPLIGDPAGSWNGKVIVQGLQPSSCSADGVCP
jgi:hypothetical protein